MNQAQIVGMAEARIKTARERLAQFSAALLEEGEDAVARSTSIFRDAADLAVWKHVAQLAGDCSLEVVVENIQSHLVSGASRPGYSTNFASNHLEQEKVRAYADAYRDLSLRLKSAQERDAQAQS